MLTNSYAYQTEVQYRHQQLREDLARRQQAKQARRNRNRFARRRTRLSHQPRPHPSPASAPSSS